MTQSTTTETELKYRLAASADGDRIVNRRSLDGLRGAAPAETIAMTDRYVDDASGALRRAGFAARLRSADGRELVSVKSTSTTAGSLQRREELEGPADGGTDPRSWPPSPARSLVLELCGDAPLVELVTIAQERRRRIFRSNTGAVEVSLDDVRIMRGDETVDRFAELEIELIEGDAGVLERVRSSLDADTRLAPAGESKLDRALRNLPGLPGGPTVLMAHEGGPALGTAAELDIASAGRAPGSGESNGQHIVAEPGFAPEAGPPTPAPDRLVTGKTPGVLGTDSLAEGGRKVLRFHLARMIAKEPGTRLGKDPEELHDMRVATRRMRAAWRVFGDGFRAAKTRRLRSRLQELARRLGAVRDLDVLLEGAEAYRRDLPKREQDALEPLFAAWRREREDARLLLLLELDDEAHGRFVRDFRDFVRTEGAAVIVPESPTTPNRVRETAGSHIWRAYEAVRAYDNVLPWADVPTLHQLRISAKWLRYTIEFFRETLGPEAEAVIPRVVALQDHLGLLNDADVGSQRIRSFLLESVGRLRDSELAAIGAYLTSRERELARLRRTVGGPWRAVNSKNFRVALGRSVAGL